MSQGLARQAIRFAVVGGGATMTHVAVALALTDAAGLRPFTANLGAFLVALLVSYFGNHAWTFAASGGHARHFPRFAAVAVPALFLNQAIVHVIVDRLGFDFRFALFLVVLIVPALSLVLNRVWVFSRPRHSAPARTRRA